MTARHRLPPSAPSGVPNKAASGFFYNILRERWWPGAVLAGAGEVGTARLAASRSVPAPGRDHRLDLSARTATGMPASDTVGEQIDSLRGWPAGAVKLSAEPD